MITSPFQTREFAEAASILGYRHGYVEQNGQAALVQTRTVGPLRTVLSRAYIYPSNACSGFIGRLLTTLNNKGVCFARIGNTMCGLEEKDALRTRGVKVIDRHTFILNLDADEEVLFHNAKRTVRNKIRKTEKEGVRAFAAEDAEHFVDYWRLSKLTTDRIRARGSIMEIPVEFFVKVFEDMVKTNFAKLFLAKCGNELLSGVLCLNFKGTMLAYHAASTRDRRLTGKHGPTACFWKAITTAKNNGLKSFDFGGCTPNLARSDPRHGVCCFKSQWRGELRQFYNGEVVLSRLGYEFQEKVLGKVWKIGHPLFNRAKKFVNHR